MKKILYRTEKDKMLGGVCGGLGEYFELDPTLIRLFFALIFFGYGTGLLLYVFLWIVMPNEAMVEARKNLQKNDPLANEEEVVVVTPDEVIEKEA